MWTLKILWIPHTAWRNQQRARPFCLTLSSRGHEVHVTNWVADFQKPRDYLSRRYLRNFKYRVWVENGVTVHHIPRVSPALYSAILRRINDSLFSRYVASIVAHHGIEAVVSTGIGSPPEVGDLIFDLYDDNPEYWLTYGGRNKSLAQEIAARERAHIAKARGIAAASPVLFDRARLRAPDKRVELIPNGVDLERFRKADGTMIRKALGLREKVIGLVGRLDREAEIHKLIEAAERLKNRDFTYLIVGGGYAEDTLRREVRERQLDQFVFTGSVPPAEVIPYFAAVDVGLCPYPKTPADDARCPIRLLEYSAVGCPVVCTNLQSVRRMGLDNVVLVEDGAEALAEGIIEACSMPRRVPRQMERYDITLLADQYEALILS